MERNIRWTTGKKSINIKLPTLLTLLFSIMLLAGCGGSGSPASSSASGGGGGGGGASKSATLTWAESKTNMDGTPLTDLAGYKVYYGTTSTQYDSVIQVAITETQLSCDFINCTYTVAGIPAGNTYYFTVTAYDTTGHESLFSNEQYALF